MDQRYKLGRKWDEGNIFVTSFKKKKKKNNQLPLGNYRIICAKFYFSHTTVGFKSSFSFSGPFILHRLTENLENISGYLRLHKVEDGDLFIYYYGQFSDASQPTRHVFGPDENQRDPPKHMENMETHPGWRLKSTLEVWIHCRCIHLDSSIQEI